MQKEFHGNKESCDKKITKSSRNACIFPLAELSSCRWVFANALIVSATSLIIMTKLGNITRKLNFQIGIVKRTVSYTTVFQVITATYTTILNARLVCYQMKSDEKSMKVKAEG